MKILLFIPLLFLAACSHKSLQKNEMPTPSHPCFKAVADNNLEYLKQNIETCKSTKTDAGTTPLMLASARGRDEVINFLLQQGVNVNETDKAMGTAINYAVVGNQPNTAALLVLAGADLDSKRPDGITALMTAVQIGSPQMIQALTASRQSVNAKAEDGWTAIYFAIRRQDPYVLKWLIRQGACKNVVDSEKISPLDFAKEVQWKDGIKIVETAPACRDQKN